jgi:hypothetical protein
MGYTNKCQTPPDRSAKTNSSNHTFCVQGPGVLTFLLYARGFLFCQKKKSEANLWATRQSEEINT